MIQAPTTVGLHFCQRLEVDPVTRLLTVNSMFQRIPMGSSSVPAQMTVYAPVTDGRGEGVMQLEIFDSLETTDPEWVYRQKKWVAFSDPAAVFNLEFRIKGVRFRKTGVHLVQLTFEGMYVSSRNLIVY